MVMLLPRSAGASVMCEQAREVLQVEHAISASS